MELLPYSAEIFAGTPDFYVARDEFARLDAAVGELGRVICAHGLHDVFGVALLHRHFELRPDERLVRHYTSRTSSVMTPEKVDTSPETALYPYLWRRADHGGMRGFYPLEFCRYTDSRDIRRYRNHMRHVARRKAFLADFAGKIAESRLDDVIALSALHARGAFRIEPRETLLELTDEASRYITLDVASTETVERKGNTTKTLWHFSPTQEQAAAAQCASHCYGHCYNHNHNRDQRREAYHG